MPFEPSRAPLLLTRQERSDLESLSRSRTEGRQRIERARMLILYADGECVSAIARALDTSRPRVDRCLDKALQIGPMAALDDLPGRGRPRKIDDDARAWVTDLACQKPKDIGYPHELWTTELLAKHIRKHARKAGHLSLAKVGKGTVSKLLTQQDIKPHKIKYYLERRDPNFDAKMAEVLCVYREVELIREGEAETSLATILSYDEKPGIQAIGNRAPDLPPKPGQHSSIGRDHEYVRHGTVSLMAGIDLLDGRVHGQVVNRHRSREFIQFLRKIDGIYEQGAKIRVILDNHSAHISKETRAFLATMPNRFEFVFTPKHGSWLNLIEMFFSKLARTMLRGIRVESKDELKRRIMQYLDMINKDPVIFRWKFQPEKAMADK